MINVSDIKTIRLRAGVRYWEDTIINGEEDISLSYAKSKISPRMQFAFENGRKDSTAPYGGYEWLIDIDVKNGRIIGWENGNTANVSYKTCDDNTVWFIGDNETVLGVYEGYVPDFLSIGEEGWGDYIFMDIEEDGTIKNFYFDENELIKLGIETQVQSIMK